LVHKKEKGCWARIISTRKAGFKVSPRAKSKKSASTKEKNPSSKIVGGEGKGKELSGLI